jgi:hypothetical protein
LYRLAELITMAIRLIAVSAGLFGLVLAALAPAAARAEDASFGMISLFAALMAAVVVGILWSAWNLLLLRRRGLIGVAILFIGAALLIAMSGQAGSVPFIVNAGLGLFLLTPAARGRANKPGSWPSGEVQ